MDDKNFEPYIDWNSLTDEMVDDMRRILVPYKEASDRLIKGAIEDVDRRREDLIQVLELQAELGQLQEAIMRTLFTVPMMVHVAGSKSVEPHHDHEHVVQRCKRCSSVLQFWQEGMSAITHDGIRHVEEDEVLWWPEGTVIAKSGDDGGISMYEIDPQDRELDEHEHPCFDLATEFSS